MKRIGLYFRVSTPDQTSDPQRLELREYCARRGWEHIEEYSDRITGSKFSRLGLSRLMGDVRAGKLSAVVCVKMDRLGRSLAHLAQVIAELENHDVALICPGQGIDTSDSNPAGKLQRHILMAVAEFERDLIRERTRAGLAAAKARGARLGRPSLELTLPRLKALNDYREGAITNLRDLAAKLGCSVGTASALVKQRSEEAE